MVKTHQYYDRITRKRTDSQKTSASRIKSIKRKNDMLSSTTPINTDTVHLHQITIVQKLTKYGGGDLKSGSRQNNT